MEAGTEHGAGSRSSRGCVRPATRSTPLRWPAWASGRIYSTRASAWTHVRDVVDVLEREDLRDVFLVGHSYGGMVISGAAELAAGRLAHLVFLDAFVPEDGQSLFDLLRPDRRALYLQAAKVHGEGWRVPPPRRKRWASPTR